MIFFFIRTRHMDSFGRGVFHMQQLYTVIDETRARHTLSFLVRSILIPSFCPFLRRYLYSVRTLAFHVRQLHGD